MKHPKFTSPAPRRGTELEFCAWLGAAATSEIREYHRSNLAADAMPLVSKLPEAERATLAKVAARARWAFERRLVHLVQRRHGPDDYSYLAIARPPPKGAAPDFVTLILKKELLE